MRRAILFAAFIAATHLSFAKSVCPRITVNSTQKAYTDTSAKQESIPVPDEMLSAIMNALGLQQNFELKQAKVLNIEASISHGKRYILYNPDFILWINQVTKNKWGAMALLAHEVGHHLNGHTIRKGGSTPALELEADEFAGFVLHKLGASLEESQEVMKYIARPEISATHPGRAARMLAIQNGWNKETDTGGATLAKKESSLSPASRETN